MAITMIALPEPPNAAEAHLVADWVELACAADVDGAWTGAKLVRARTDRDQRERATAETPIGPTNPADDDRRQDEAETIWRILRRRAREFRRAYPFTVDPSETSIETRKRDRVRVTYSFLLCAANLNAIARDQRHVLTSAFERTSKHAIAGLLPGRARVAVFGTAAPEGTRYHSGNVTTRLRRLAVDLGSQLTEAGESVSPYSSGDGGLDIVGWPRLAPPNTKLPVIFAQCACGKDWPSKQYAVNPDTWEPRMAVTFRILPVTVIPYAFRDEAGGWHRVFDIGNGVLIDRLRLLQLLGSRKSSAAYADVPGRWIREALPGLQATS